jgi:alanine or glycine:cation symporter, AGCS family
MDISFYIKILSNWAIGWPLMIYVVGASIIFTIAFHAVQFRYFFSAWKTTLFPPQHSPLKAGHMTPIQAFINTLSSSIGNGSLAGMATAVYAGGPGAAFWVIIFGFLLMAVRFAEVYTSTLYGTSTTANRSTLGGPMLYLKYVIGGNVLSYCYAIFCLLFGLFTGNAMQANSIRLSVATTWGVPPLASAIMLLLFVLYVVCGGAPRIIKASDRIVPIKVGVFFVASFVILIFHYASLWQAIILIVSSAFKPLALAGGVIGFTVQQAVSYGLFRSIVATESGLGTAAILFGFTGSDKPMTSGFMGMIGTFVSTLVCFLVALCIVVSGVWNTGLNSTALTIAAYNTVFGSFGGWIVSFLSISFGVGVLVTYAYIVRAAWLFLTNGRFEFMFIFLYSFFCFAGALMTVEIVWDIINIANGGLLLINLFGLLYLLPRIRKDVIAQMK